MFARLPRASVPGAVVGGPQKLSDIDKAFYQASVDNARLLAWMCVALTSRIHRLRVRCCSFPQPEASNVVPSWDCIGFVVRTYT